MRSENRIGSPEEEIAKLKQKIFELKGKSSGKELQGRIKETIKKHSEKKPEQFLTDKYRISAEETKERANQLKNIDFETEEKKHQAQIVGLLQIVQNKGVLNAVSVAKRLEDVHLEDDFHDALVKYLSTAVTPVSEAEVGGGFGRGKRIKKALNFILFEITLPQEKPNEKTEERAGRHKELIAVMEQFYSGMSALGSYFALEVGLPFSGDEVVFYCAVPRDKANLFEKQLQGLYPSAKIEVKKDDYNIFKPEGFSSGSIVKLKRNAILPIKTYDKFGSDPIQVILNTFSKLEKDGEGAAFQIIISPGGGGLAGKAKKIALKMRDGKSFSEAVGSDKNIIESVFGALRELFFGSSEKEKSGENKPKPVNEKTVKLLEEKASRPAMMSNIRLLVSSSQSREKAESILSELESAFLQFEETQGNAFYFSRPKRGKLRKLFYNFSFRIPKKKNMIPLNIAELATVFHFPSGITAVSAPQLKYVKTKESSPPLNLPQSGLLLGKNIYRGEERPIYMKEGDRRRHFYIIGQTGTGKSVLIKNMITQDIEAGRGCCFIDPHGSDLQDILARIPEERAEDVIYFNPGDTARPMGLNMLEYDTRYPEQKSFIVDELLGIFNKLFDMKTAGGPMFEQYFRNSVMLVMDDPDSGNTLFEVSRILSDKEFRNYKLSRSRNPIIKTFWKEVAEKAGGEAALANMVPYITSKFDNFLGNDIMRPIIGQEKSSFNFRQVMDEGKILLINLSKGRLGELNANLIGLIVVGKLLMASLSRVDTPEEKRRDFYLYIDEFQNVTTSSIATILSEARKYKLNFTIAHQFIGQLEENINKAVFGNVGSICSFRVGAEDAEFLEKQFEPVFNSHDLVNIDNYNAYLKILVDNYVSRPFNIQTLPFQKGDPVLGEKIADISSIKYGRPRKEVENEINKRYDKDV